jgi:two-component system NtrC family sensor kinase
MLELATAPMVVTEGTDHSVFFANQAFCSLIGCTQEELIGKSFMEVLGEGDACEGFLDRVLHAGGPLGHAERQLSECHPVNWSYEIWPLRAVSGHPAGLMIKVSETSRYDCRTAAMNEALLLSAIRQHELVEEAEALNEKLEAEMKERIQAEDALIRVEKLAAVGRMAASMAHEINNPLEAVMNSIFLAKSLPELSETARKYLEIADEELRRVSHMTRQTLGFYRESTVPTGTSVSALLDSVIDLLQAKIKMMHAHVDRRCVPELQVMGVFGELRQIVSNLLANSLDAVDKQGTIKVRGSIAPCRDNGQRCIRITVADNGKGIDPVAMKRVFEPFFTTKGDVGTGLGLWVTKQLVEKHDGAIHVRSSTTGIRRGTTVSIVLPRIVAA